MFASVKARLKPDGYYLVSSSVYEPSRHTPESKVIDATTGQTYDVYDGDCLYDPTTDYYFEPLEKFPSAREQTESCGDTLVVNGAAYIPKRCYRDGRRLRSELASHGFDCIFQQGEFDENLICVHEASAARGSPSSC